MESHAVERSRNSNLESPLTYQRETAKRRLSKIGVRAAFLSTMVSVFMVGLSIASAATPPYTGATAVQSATFTQAPPCSSANNNGAGPTFSPTTGFGTFNITATATSNGTCTGGGPVAVGEIGIASYSITCYTLTGCANVATNWTQNYSMSVTGGGPGCTPTTRWWAQTWILYNFTVATSGGTIVAWAEYHTTKLVDGKGPATCQTDLTLTKLSPWPYTAQVFACAAPSSGGGTCGMPNSLSSGTAYTMTAFIEGVANTTLVALPGTGVYATAYISMAYPGGQCLQSVGVW
jgi:hypothetical protein